MRPVFVQVFDIWDWPQKTRDAIIKSYKVPNDSYVRFYPNAFYMFPARDKPWRKSLFNRTLTQIKKQGWKVQKQGWDISKHDSVYVLLSIWWPDFYKPK